MQATADAAQSARAMALTHAAIGAHHSNEHPEKRDGRTRNNVRHDTRPRVGVRELRQNLSVYLRRVRRGETLEVTERGNSVALLDPVPREPDPVDAWRPSGAAGDGCADSVSPRLARTDIERGRLRRGAARREAEQSTARASKVLDLVNLIDLDRAVLDAARALELVGLRPLDATTWRRPCRSATTSAPSSATTAGSPKRPQRQGSRRSRRPTASRRCQAAQRSRQI
jgi:prevent-host-death family protein